jgi:tetratricopeptide (TPR) repeat protein
LPIVAFGLLFYYLTLSVESSVIPISDLMFEHRTYLPNFGLLLAVIYFISCAKMIPNSLKLILLISSILVFGTLTWQRNDLWRDPVAFYDAAIDNSPGQSRNWVALSQVYFKYNEDGKALNLLRKELRKNKNRNNGVINEPLYVLAFWSQLLRANGLDDKADRVERIYGINKDSKTKQRMLLEQGNNELLKSQYGKAVDYYNQVLDINPNHENAQINLGVVAMMEGKLDQAEVIFQRFPNNSVSRSNLPLISNLRKGNTTIGSMERKVFEKNH